MEGYGELNKINNVFVEYVGAKYTIQYFTISLGKLIILIESEESDKVVYLASVATKYIKGNIRQKNIHLEASKDTMLYDQDFSDLILDGRLRAACSTPNWHSG
jgi:hypothetical protein